MINKIKQFLIRCFAYETSPHKLALACGLGAYVAFSPFFGFHTFMLMGFSVLLRLNFPLLFAICYGINNPLTMVPVYMSGYMTGYWMLHKWWGVALSHVNPAWMQPVNQFLHSYIGLADVSFWAFMIGCNILGMVVGLVSYIVLERAFYYLALPQNPT